MQKLLDETEYRRKKQIAYNEEHGIVPRTVNKVKKDIFADVFGKGSKAYEQAQDEVALAADLSAEYLSKDKLKEKIGETRKKMEAAAKELNFIEAARLRDEMYALQGMMKDKR